MIKNKKKGLSLIEMLIGLIIGGSLTVVGIDYIEDKSTNIKIDNLSKKISLIIKGFDKRIENDGYSSNYWSNVLEYNTNKEVQDFLKRELIAKEASCGDTASGWNPRVNTSDPSEILRLKKSKLIPCVLWTNDKIEFNLKSSLRLQKGIKNIEKISLYFYFENEKDFKNNFNSFKQIYRKSKAYDEIEKTGSHKYSFVDMSQTNPSLFVVSMKECSTLKDKCGLMAEYNSDGTGVEYLDVNGKNSMIGTKVSFAEEETSGKVDTCSTYTFDITSNKWVKTNNVVCGLGIDKNRNLNYVDADIHQGSTKRISFDNICKIMVGGIETQKPCGMYTEIKAGVIKKNVISAFDENHSNHVLIDILNAKNTKSNDLETSGDLNVQEKANLNNMIAKEEANFLGKVTIEELDNKKTHITVEKNFDVASKTTINNLNAKKDVEIKNNLNVYNNLIVEKGALKTDSLYLEQLELKDLHTNCESSMIGALKTIKLNKKIENVVCTRYKDIKGKTKTAWKLANAQVGQIMPFDRDCPDGFDYHVETAGRFLIGENESLLQGKSISEIQDLINNKKVFLDGNGNVLRYGTGNTGGEAFHTLTIEEMPSHAHDVPTIKATCTGSNCAGVAVVQIDVGANSYWNKDSSLGSGSKVMNSATGGNFTNPTNGSVGGKAHENRPPFYTVKYCIYSGVN